MEYTNIAVYIEHLSYLGVFLWFAIIEQFTPIPEEISLMSMGYIAIHTGLNPVLCCAAALAGLLTMDNTLFYLSMKGSHFTQQLFDKLNTQLVDRVQEHLKKHAVRTLLISALIPQLRFFSPVIAALSHIRWKVFFLVNGAATLFYTVVYMLLGILFHQQLTRLLKKLHLTQHIIFILMMLVITVYILRKAGKMLLKASKHK